MRAIMALTGDLPGGFQPRDVLSFHQRDVSEIAERVRDAVLEKGLFLRGRPALLRLRLGPGEFAAELSAREGGSPEDEAWFAAMIRRMLGLGQDVEGFAARFLDHPELGSLVAARPGLRVPCAATPFEAVAWAIAGQQISVRAALSLRRGLIQAAGAPIEGGLLCHPDAAAVAGLGPDDLGRAGFSRSKARALLAACQGAANGSLDLDGWALKASGDGKAGDFDAAAARQALLAVPGIGPWTADYVLLRGFGHLDGSLHGDAAVRRGLRDLLKRRDKLSQEETRRWLEAFSPYRALAAAHLWAAQSNAGY